MKNVTERGISMKQLSDVIEEVIDHMYEYTETTTARLVFEVFKNYVDFYRDFRF